MKMLLILSAAIAMNITSAFAYDNTDDQYNLKKLDVLGTCKIGTAQEENAELGLSFLKAIFSWHVGDQVAMAHPGFIAWHSAMTDLLVTFPVYRDKVPFKNGQFTRDTIVSTMSFIAYSNDSEAYTAKLKRVDCVGDDKAIFTADFKSVQLQRDPTTGCITHKVSYASPLKISLQLKEASATDSQKLVYRFDTLIDDQVTINAREELARVVKTQPALKPDPATCKTNKMIYDEFKAQVNN